MGRGIFTDRVIVIDDHIPVHILCEGYFPGYCYNTMSPCNEISLDGPARPSMVEACAYQRLQRPIKLLAIVPLDRLDRSILLESVTAQFATCEEG
jgi:hypothetical protein